jgi:hypothetical protein
LHRGAQDAYQLFATEFIAAYAYQPCAIGLFDAENPGTGQKQGALAA